MQFYPLGSSSFNQIYNTTLAVTASVSSYAETASYGLRVVTASHALSGFPGINGNAGTCSFTPGPTGDTGLTGFGGSPGGISVVIPKP